ncbi:MAG: ComEC/Rec2 family competence protein [Candidatus Levyibacteriota bacterium]
MKVKLFILSLSVVFLAGFFIYQAAFFSDGRLHVVFCDVGQGDGIYIRTSAGSDILIDAGPDNSILDCLSRHMPMWDRTIELAFATHPDADHIGGFGYILKAYTVNSFNTSQKTSATKAFAQIRDLISQKHVPLRYIFNGDEFRLPEGIRIHTYWPTHLFVDANQIDADTNSFSLVQILTYKNFKTLFTGDIESGALDSIFSRGLTVDVFKIPHHGSKTGVDDLTFNLIHSKFVPISSGLHNRYNHPSPVVLELLKKYKIPYKNTALVGDIEIVTDGTGANIVATR